MPDRSNDTSRLAPRIPVHAQEPGFLESLRARGEVLDVSEEWSEISDVLPPGVTWIRFPNGDLRRMRI